ncbi:DUF3618 domain-containing protein [Chthonobacter albigriseus]|uniref:DUF3618 domain-containing protein n=1 Tax=Chthonobacter albigriseus TaxID=1683161 RepID=UPI0015EEBB71|nr:DUF3618 domain-containing protein [Chthonobacter albigriseus]
MTSTHDQNPDRIETEVEEARARLTRTLDEIRDRMSPGQILDQALDYARQSGGGEFTRNLGRSVRDNPLPLLMMGAGMAWLMASDRRSGAAAGRYPAAGYAEDQYGNPVDTSPGFGERVGDVAGRASHAASSAYHGAADTAGGIASSVKNAASSVASAVGSAVHSVGDAASGAASAVGGAASSIGSTASSVGHRAGSMAGSASSYGRSTGENLAGYGSQVRHGWSRLLQDQPLVAGAIGLAIGAAIGAALPSTRAEDRLMGDTADRLKDQARDTARSTYGEVRSTASEVASDAMRTVDEKGLSGASIGEAIDRAAEKIGEKTGLSGSGDDKSSSDGRDKPEGEAGQRTASAGTSATPGSSSVNRPTGRPADAVGATSTTRTPS